MPTMITARTQCVGKTPRALSRADNRRNARSTPSDRRRDRSPARADRARDRPRSGQREPNRVKQRAALLPASSASRDRRRRGTWSCRAGAGRWPAPPPARRSPAALPARLGLRPDRPAAPTPSAAENSNSCLRRCGNLVEPIDRCVEHRDDAVEERQPIGVQRTADVAGALEIGRRQAPRAARGPRPSGNDGSPTPAFLRRTRWRCVRHRSARTAWPSRRAARAPLLARRPAQQREVVQQRLGQVSLLAELVHGHRAVPLRQLACDPVRGPSPRGRTAGGVKPSAS